MRTHARVLVGAAALAGVVWLLASPGNAGNGKDTVFKPILPKDEYQELAKRAIKEIQDRLASKDDDDHKRAQGIAMTLAGYIRSAKDVDDKERATLHKAALDIVEAVKKEKVADARKIAAPAMSSSVPIRCAGIRFATSSA